MMMSFLFLCMIEYITRTFLLGPSSCSLYVEPWGYGRAHVSRTLGSIISNGDSRAVSGGEVR